MHRIRLLVSEGMWLILWLCLLSGAASAHGHRAASLKFDYQSCQGRSNGCSRGIYTDLDHFFYAPPQWKVKTSEEHQGKLDYEQLNKTLLPLIFEPLPLGTVKPRGWFHQQLELMAEGLPGHLHDFYRLVRNSTWGGGHEEYSILNEAWPYYINGLVPLAFALDDQRLLSAINDQISFVLLSQFRDGWLGPEEELATRNFWGRYPFFLAAAQYVEAAPQLESRTMLQAMHRFVNIMHAMLKNDYQGYVWKQGDRFDEQWGRSRAADMLLALQWLYENYPDNNQARIHECMFMIYEKAYDWSWWFSDDNFLKEDVESYPPELIDPLFPFLHGVNAAQGLKSPAVMARIVHSQSLLDSSRQGVKNMFDYHGTSSGAIIGDERISGKSPTRGTELCSVVETMFSLSTLYNILGDNTLADRLENAAFNAMPTMIMPKWWAHQYIAQANQPYSYELRGNLHFWNVGPWGITFGTEPNYPCCTVNFPQGYPKLLSNSWVRTPEDNGLAHVVLLPSEVKTILRSVHDGETFENFVSIKCNTNYPFTQLLTYHVEAQGGFKLSIRIPEWVDVDNPKTGLYLDKDKNNILDDHNNLRRPLSYMNRDPERLKPDPHTGLHTIAIPAGPLTFSVYLSPFATPNDTKPLIHERPNSAVAITHGALLYAHTLHGVYTPRRPINYQLPGEAPPEASDWTIVPREENTMPDTNPNATRAVPWNIAIDPFTARVHEYQNLYNSPDCCLDGAQNCQNDFPNPIWSENAPPVSISVMACEIKWDMTSPVEHENGKAVRGGYPLPPPAPDAKTGRHKCVGRAFPVELKPYGSAKIRMAELPVVDLGPMSEDLVDV